MNRTSLLYATTIFFFLTSIYLVFDSNNNSCPSSSHITASTTSPPPSSLSPSSSCWHVNNLPIRGNASRFLTGCILFKNEGRYLKEWLVYHLLGGFDHMYMYDDGSTDDPIPILQPFIDRGYVTYIEWGGRTPGRLQTEQIRHCRGHFNSSSEWLSIFDLDEFFVPYFERSHPDETGFISRMLYDHYSDAAGVEVHRAQFDCSGHAKPVCIVRPIFLFFFALLILMSLWL
eukprot:TRINITY_DN10047_c0_g1_i1.p1 TRINITY_DN10047_c0_g1~~TRINITY_DN10047_c0_g1_i1.p1  ORF type:complete len:230 (+),score=46.66 TRINITY_DN10047_c0_g1_i1:50-739(+)